MKKNLVRKIFPAHVGRGTGSTWVAPAGVEEVTVSVFDKFNKLISYGGQNGYALKRTGVAYGWGLNNLGQVGDATIVAKSIVTLITGGHSFVQLSGGSTAAAALKADGTAWTWGNGTSGQLGDGTIVSKSVPTAAIGGHSFIQISAGDNYTSALKVDGKVWSWGDNTYGQLGDNTTIPKSSPVVMGVSFIFRKLCPTDGFTNMAIGLTDAIFCWGRNSGGQLGTGSAVASELTPVQILGAGTSKYLDAVMGGTHAVSIQTDGTAWTWGTNTFGQLGNNNSDIGGSQNKSSPVAVIGGHSFIQVAAGSAVSAALKADGSAWTWGVNAVGQLGDGTIVPKSSPVPVIGGHSFLQIEAAGSTMAALKVDGSIWTWGSNSSGELADSTIVSKSSPIQVIGGNLFEAGVQFLNKRTFTVTPGSGYFINGFLTQIGSQSMVTNTGNNVYIVLEYYA